MDLEYLINNVIVFTYKTSLNNVIIVANNFKYNYKYKINHKQYIFTINFKVNIVNNFEIFVFNFKKSFIIMGYEPSPIILWKLIIWIVLNEEIYGKIIR